MDYIHQIESFAPCGCEERLAKETVLRYCELYDNILERSCESAHMTASSWIVSRDGKKVVMIWHNIYKSWAWTGGHCDGDGDLLAVALKEAREECGLQSLEPFCREPISIEIIPVPQHEKHGKIVPTHQHLNATFLLVADSDETPVFNPEENSGAKWMDCEDAFEQCSEPGMVVIYRRLQKKAEQLLAASEGREGLPKTVKLYDACSHMRDFDAVVLSCGQADDDLFKVVLDRTAFFPEGGGQLADTGKIGDSSVIDVQLNDGVIYHLCEHELNVGDTYECEIDWGKRFRRMQQHSGEHIVSGIVNRLYGYSNVGFHLGEEEVTLDFDGALTREDLCKVEKLANEAIGENRRIICEYPDTDTLEALKYRSKLDLSEDVRIVTIEGWDCCACCAPHCSMSGEVGSVKLLDFSKHKDGVRINMLCGNDACADSAEKYRNILSISALLSAKQHETATAVEKVLADKAELEYRITKVSELLVKAWLLSVEPGTVNPCIFVEAPDVASLRELVNGLVESCSGLCGAFSGNDDEGYSCVIGSSSIKLRALSKDIFAALSGKGGGRDEMLQGKASATEQSIRDYFINFTVDSV